MARRNLMWAYSDQDGPDRLYPEGLTKLKVEAQVLDVAMTSSTFMDEDSPQSLNITILSDLVRPSSSILLF